jgi:hypothetical protein
MGEKMLPGEKRQRKLEKRVGFQRRLVGEKKEETRSRLRVDGNIE